MTETPRRLHPRARLRRIFTGALGAVNGCSCVARALRSQPISEPVWAVAIGKAAPAMLRGALAVCQVEAALVITKAGHCGVPSGAACLEAGHPLPDERSLAAGEALRRFLGEAPATANFLFLVSGGASALVECLPKGVTLGDLVRVNDWLLASGLEIHAVNRVRRSLSLIKGGRLGALLRGRPALNLLISDVAGDDPAVIGSGLLVPSDDGQGLEALGLPGWLSRLTERAPPAFMGELHNVRTLVVARPADARRAAVEAGHELGYAVFEHPELLLGDAAEAGRRVVAELRQNAPGLHVWGGETTVRLPPKPGRGGRCQHLALSAALDLRGHGALLVLAAGTDGTDGNTEDAGAWADAETVARGEGAGLSAEGCLAAADAGSFLAASGDLLRTGPTGTNVMDLILGLRVR